jgi:hypothetical protein
MNEQNFWALDDVSMKKSGSSTELINNGDFEADSWTPWTYWLASNSVYDGSGMSYGYGSCNSHGGYYFYVDVQYTAGDGIFQNVTTVAGKNYTISFYLANPLGGNVSVAIVSVG